MDRATAAIQWAAGLRCSQWAARTDAAASISAWRALGYGCGRRLECGRMGDSMRDLEGKIRLPRNDSQEAIPRGCTSRSHTE